MTYNFIAIPDSYKRLMWGIIADSRANIPEIKNKIGSVIKAYVDSQTVLVNPSVIPYKIEVAETGALVGYFGLFIGPGPVLIKFQQIRPAFTEFSTDISNSIINFILSNNWAFDTIN